MPISAPGALLRSGPETGPENRQRRRRWTVREERWTSGDPACGVCAPKVRPIRSRVSPAAHAYRVHNRQAPGAAGAGEAADRDVGETAAGEHESQDGRSACDSWLTVFDTLAAAGKKSPASARRFREVIEWYVLPTLGTKTLRDLSTESINALYQHLLTTGKPARPAGARPKGRVLPPRPLAAATVQKTHVALSLAMTHAVKLGWLDVNPADKAVRPQTDTENRPVVAPAPEAIQDLLAEADRVDPEWACYIRVSASLGSRRGETVALRWSAVDLRGATVTVASVVSVGVAGPGLRDRPKTKRGVRQVALDRGTADVLRAQHVHQMERAMACGTKLVADPFVFASDIEGSLPMDPRVMTTRFMRLRDRLGLAVRLHDLRHHVATQPLAAGVDVVTVAGRLGQDPAVTLRTYSHFVPARDRAAADIMAGLLDGSSAPGC
jgi:integrase